MAVFSKVSRHIALLVVVVVNSFIKNIIHYSHRTEFRIIYSDPCASWGLSLEFYIFDN